MGCSSSKAQGKAQEEPSTGQSEQVDADRERSFEMYQELKRMLPGRKETWKMLSAVGVKHMPKDSYSPEMDGGPMRFKSLSAARVGLCTIDGAQQHDDALKNKTNQDFGLLRHPLVPGNPGQMLAGVFDGHGVCGEVSSHFAGITISQVVATAVASGKGMDEILSMGIATAQAQLEAKMPPPVYLNGGTTAVVAHLDSNASSLTVAHVGDARLVTAVDAMSGWVVGEETSDHRPNDEVEKARVVSAGGIIKEVVLSDGSGSIFRVADSNPDNPKAAGLAVARSLGDGSYKPLGVVADPTIMHINLTADYRCVILGSDGLFEFMSNEEAIKIVFEFRSNASVAAEKLTRAAAKRWADKSPHYRDDITAVVILLPVEGPDPPSQLSQALNTDDLNAAQFTSASRVSTDARLTVDHDPHLRESNSSPFDHMGA